MKKLKKRYYVTFQCGHYSVFKKIKKKNFDPQKVKKRASKVAHNFIVQPRPQPQIREQISGPNISQYEKLILGCGPLVWAGL